MLIKLLGTSSMFGFPRENCNCPQCVSNDVKDKRTRSSLLIDNKILIDCGPDIKYQLKSEILNLKSILITHEHFDHTDGLKDILFNLSKDCKIYISKFHFLRLKILKNYKDKIIFIYPKRNYQINNHQVRFLQIAHNKSKKFSPYFAPIINYKLIYATDFSQIDRTFESVLHRLKLMFLDGSILKHSALGHMSIYDQFEYLKKLNLPLKGQKIYFTHNGHTHIPHQELENKIQQLFNSKDVYLAYDKLELKI